MPKLGVFIEKLGVRVKALLAISLIFSLVVLTQTWVTIRQGVQQSHEISNKEVQEIYADYNNQVELLQQSAAALSIILADRADVQQFLPAQNREDALQRLQPVFTALKTYNIVHLYLENPDGTVLVRVHSPTQFGDDITYRRIAAAALATHQTVAGLEIGSNRLGIYGISPVFAGDQFVGMVEVGIDYDTQFLQTMHRQTGADYKLWIETNVAAPAQLKSTATAPSSPLDRLFFYAETTSLQWNIPAGVYQQVLTDGNPQIQFVTVGDQYLAVMVAPMVAYNNRIIGIVEIALPRTGAVAELQQSHVNSLLLAGGLILLALLLATVASGMVVLRPLRHLNTIATRQLEGDLSARIGFNRHDEFGQLGNTFDALTATLQKTLKDQEVIIQQRTNQLQVAIEVTRQLSSILEFDQLLKAVVNLVRNRFNLYHVHIYLLDTDANILKMVEGYGQAGETMKARGHSIPLEAVKSLVARAARSANIVRIDNVAIEEGWLPNPLLPRTRSEMAIPVKLSTRTVGVLDVQSDQLAGFDDQLQTILQTVADSIAVAVRNAERFAETTRALTEAQKIQRLYLQPAWQEYLAQQKTTVYQYIKPGAPPLEQLAPLPDNPPVSAAKVTVVNGQTSTNPASLAFPLLVRGQPIGHIKIHDTQPDRTWTPDEIALLQGIGEQMSLALENVRLFQQTQQRAAREKLAADITAQVWAAGNLPTILQTAVLQLGTTLQAEKVVIRLGTANQFTVLSENSTEVQK